jgi:predicted Zn-dependent protease
MAPGLLTIDGDPRGTSDPDRLGLREGSTMSYGDDSGDGGGSRLPLGRLIGALVIALLGFVIYMSQTQVNPVTGQKQHVAMSPDQEMSLGLQAAPQMAQQMGGDVDASEDPRAALVDEIGRRLVRTSEARKSPYVENFHFHLLRDPKTVNAFALPGGQVFITVGLLDRLENEAQLAGVLGHEIGHVINRHSAQQMAKGQLGQILTVAVGVGASDSNDRGRRAQMVAAMVNQMTQLRYSRKDESEADHYGLKYMAESGYDPSAMLDVMKILKKASGDSHPPEFLATHPLPDTRLEEIRAELKQDYPDGIPSNLIKGRPLRPGPDSGRERYDPSR